MKLKYAMKLEYAVSVGNGRDVIYVLTVPVGYEAFDSTDDASKYIPQYGRRFEARFINLLLRNGKESCFIALYDTLNDCIVDRVYWDQHLKYSSVLTKREAAGKYSRKASDYEPNKLTFSEVFKLHAQDKHTHSFSLEYISSYITPALVCDDTNQIIKEFENESKKEMDVAAAIVALFKMLSASKEDANAPSPCIA
jgi:hypothetical protein